jgi:hypothetical protein
MSHAGRHLSISIYLFGDTFLAVLIEALFAGQCDTNFARRKEQSRLLDFRRNDSDDVSQSFVHSLLTDGLILIGN